jgi:hypothetical protein
LKTPISGTLILDNHDLSWGLKAAEWNTRGSRFDIGHIGRMRLKGGLILPWNSAHDTLNGAQVRLRERGLGLTLDGGVRFGWGSFVPSWNSADDTQNRGLVDRHTPSHADGVFVFQEVGVERRDR